VENARLRTCDSFRGCTLVAILAFAGMFASVSEGQSATSSQSDSRTRAEIEALIEQVGREKPDWWDAVGLTYPATLDLDWPLRPMGDWNARKNVGQYIWDIINPNPGRWQEGIKLVHFLMIRHKDDRAKMARSMEVLGRMFHDLMEDWARAVFWWHLSERYGGRVDPLRMAHCYWRLGNKSMAAEVLSSVSYDYTRHGALIKLWADMGEFDKALRLAEQKAAAGMPVIAYLAAGDTCRLAGRYEQAIQYYDKVLDPTLPQGGRQGDEDKAKERARASIEAIKLFDTLDVTQVADGTYKASSIAYAGPLEVEVTVANGHLDFVRVTQHREKQFYSALTETPKQIVARQGVKGVDAVTGATMTSEAIINATAKALAGGMR